MAGAFRTRRTAVSVSGASTAGTAKVCVGLAVGNVVAAGVANGTPEADGSASLGDGVGRADVLGAEHAATRATRTIKRRVP
jgi:hypothetical protein